MYLIMHHQALMAWYKELREIYEQVESAELPTHILWPIAIA